jgi:hypothetical protein
MRDLISKLASSSAEDEGRSSACGTRARKKPKADELTLRYQAHYVCV